MSDDLRAAAQRLADGDVPSVYHKEGDPAFSFLAYALLDGIKLARAYLADNQVAAEREACAKLVVELFDEMRLWENVKDGGEALASAIRARAS